MRRFGLLLMALGVGLIAFLCFGKTATKNHQEELVKNFQMAKAEKIAEVGTAKLIQTKMGDAMVGVLTIPEIDLHLPVVSGAGKKQLDQALGTIPGLDEPGKLNGSFAIAGHRSAAFGKFFNRLDELESGSLVELETGDQQMIFKVFDKRVVAPEEIDVLHAQKGKALLSLVTCHPQHSSKYRLVIQAERIQ